MEYWKKKYEGITKRVKELHESGNALTKLQMEVICPELRDGEDERIRKEIVDFFSQYKDDGIRGVDITSWIAYLEKQKDASKAIEAVERIDKYIDEQVVNAHDMNDSNPDKKYYSGWDDALGEMSRILLDVYSDEKQKEQKPAERSEDEKIRKSLINYVYCHGDAGDFTKKEFVAYLEKQKDEAQKQFNLGVQAGKEEVMYEMEKEQKDDEGDFTIYYPLKNGKGEYECIPYSFYGSVDIDFLHTCFYTKEECEEWIEKQKEQNPTESISLLTVQGKGVYKICPRCKERMVRDDSKVYTSIPPKYGYTCPKCGAMEFDTVMYDSPEMEEQKPADQGVKGRRGRIGVTPEHIRKKAENFLSKMEPPYDADDICSAYETGAMENIKLEWSEDERIRNRIRLCLDECVHSDIIRDYERDECLAYLEKQKDLTKEGIIKQLEEEFYACETTPKWFHNTVQGAINHGRAEALGEIKANEPPVSTMGQKEQKPAEWSEEDSRILYNVIAYVGYAAGERGVRDDEFKEANSWLKSLPERFNLQPRTEWSDEDEKRINYIFEDFKQDVIPDEEDQEWLKNRLKSLRPKPHWKPSEEQMDILDKVYHYLWADRNATADMQDGLGDFIDELKSL